MRLSITLFFLAFVCISINAQSLTINGASPMVDVCELDDLNFVVTGHTCTAPPVSFAWEHLEGGVWVARGTTNTESWTLAGVTKSTDEGSWRVSILDRSSCTEKSDTVIVNIQEPLIANAGPDKSTCGMTPIQLEGNSNGQAGEWTTIDGNGSFDDASKVDATYRPHSSDVGRSFMLTWTTFAQVPCSEVSSSMTLTVDVEREADAGNNQMTCGNIPVNLNATTNGTGEWTGGNGTFDPSRSDPMAMYTPDANEFGTTVTLTWTTFAKGACLAVQSSMMLTVQEPLIANAGPDKSTCGMTPIQLEGNSNGQAGEWTTIDGNGSFDDASKVDATYRPHSSDVGRSFMLTWTTFAQVPCSEVSSSMTLTVDVEREADAGNNQMTCGDIPVNLNATTNGSGEWTGGNGTFDPSRSDPMAMYTPDANEFGTTVTLTWTTFAKGACLAVQSSMMLTVQEPLIANAGPDKSTCGMTPIQLEGNSNGQAGEWTTIDGNGSFDDASKVDATYRPHSSDVGRSFMLTWTTFAQVPCSEVSSSMTLTVDVEREADAGNNQMTCGDIPVNLNATTNGSGEWTGGNGTFDPSRSDPMAMYTPDANEFSTTVTLTWTTFAKGACLAVQSSMMLTVQEPLIANAGPDKSTCGTSSIQLNASPSNSGGWISGSGDFSQMDDPKATYTPDQSEEGTDVMLIWEVSGRPPCPAVRDTMILTVHKLPNSAFTVPDFGELCDNRIYKLTAVDQSGNNNYRWLPGNIPVSNISGPKTDLIIGDHKNRTTNGKYNIQLTAVNRNTKCKDTTSNEIAIIKAPFSDFLIKDLTGVSDRKEILDMSRSSIEPNVEYDRIDTWKYSSSWEGQKELIFSNSPGANRPNFITEEFLTLGQVYICLVSIADNTCSDTIKKSAIIQNEDCDEIIKLEIDELANGNCTDSLASIKVQWNHNFKNEAILEIINTTSEDTTRTIVDSGSNGMWSATMPVIPGRLNYFSAQISGVLASDTLRCFDSEFLNVLEIPDPKVEVDDGYCTGDTATFSINPTHWGELQFSTDNLTFTNIDSGSTNVDFLVPSDTLSKLYLKFNPDPECAEILEVYDINVITTPDVSHLGNFAICAGSMDTLDFEGINSQDSYSYAWEILSNGSKKEKMGTEKFTFVNELLEGDYIYRLSIANERNGIVCSSEVVENELVISEAPDIQLDTIDCLPIILVTDLNNSSTNTGEWSLNDMVLPSKNKKYLEISTSGTYKFKAGIGEECIDSDSIEVNVDQFLRLQQDDSTTVLREHCDSSTLVFSSLPPGAMECHKWYELNLLAGTLEVLSDTNRYITTDRTTSDTSIYFYTAECDCNGNVYMSLRNEDDKNCINPPPQAILYPNPSNGELSLEFEHFPKGSYSMHVIDMLGSNIINRDLWTDNSAFSLNLNLMGLSSGVYNIYISGQGVSFSTSFIIQR